MRFALVLLALAFVMPAAAKEVNDDLCKDPATIQLQKDNVAFWHQCLIASRDAYLGKFQKNMPKSAPRKVRVNLAPVPVPMPPSRPRPESVISNGVEYVLSQECHDLRHWGTYQLYLDKGCMKIIPYPRPRPEMLARKHKKSPPVAGISFT
jgi:hypothetical protein